VISFRRITAFTDERVEVLCGGPPLVVLLRPFVIVRGFVEVGLDNVFDPTGNVDFGRPPPDDKFVVDGSVDRNTNEARGRANRKCNKERGERRLGASN